MLVSEQFYTHPLLLATFVGVLQLPFKYSEMFWGNKIRRIEVLDVNNQSTLILINISSIIDECINFEMTDINLVFSTDKSANHKPAIDNH